MNFSSELNILNHFLQLKHRLRSGIFNMIQHKIIEILKTFSREDIKKFRDYLNSPFFNKSEKILKLFETLITYHPDFNSRNLTEELIFKKVNPGQSFNISTLRNLLFDLANAADNYLAVLNFSGREIEKSDFLRDELFQRKLSKQLESSLKKSLLLLNEEKNFDSAYFLNKFRISTDTLNMDTIVKHRSGSEYVSTVVENFTEHGKILIQFFVKEISRVYDNLNNYKKNFEINEENNFIFSMLKILDFEKLLNYLIENTNNNDIKIVFRMQLASYLAFSKMDDDKYYYDYKKLILDNFKNLNPEFLRSYAINLIRYCMLKSKLNDGAESDKFNKERFEVYNLILDHELYKMSHSVSMPIAMYRPVLQLSLELKKYTWAFNFIKKYKSELPPDRQENMYNFSCAEYYFSRGKYAEAMKSFHKVKYDHFMLKIDMKNLMLKTFYELELFDNALSLIDTYRHFLANDKTLSVSEKSSNKNFVNVIQKMITYRISLKKQGLYSVESEIKKDFTNKEWVLEKFMQLDRKYEKSA